MWLLNVQFKNGSYFTLATCSDSSSFVPGRLFRTNVWRGHNRVSRGGCRNLFMIFISNIIVTERKSKHLMRYIYTSNSSMDRNVILTTKILFITVVRISCSYVEPRWCYSHMIFASIWFLMRCNAVRCFPQSKQFCHKMSFIIPAASQNQLFVIQ